MLLMIRGAIRATKMEKEKAKLERVYKEWQKDRCFTIRDENLILFSAMAICLLLWILSAYQNIARDFVSAYYLDFSGK